MGEYRSNCKMMNHAVRRSMWLALGIKDEDMARPKIAIINSSSNLAICYSNLDEIAKYAQKEIYKAGGLPFEIRTVAPADFLYGGHGGGFILGSRDLITNEIISEVFNA